MQSIICSNLFKCCCITIAAVFSLGTTASLQAGQLPYTTPTNSGGNNFTMIDPGNGLVGGTNDVAFTWDGTINDAVAGAVSNATITSDEAFSQTLLLAADRMVCPNRHPKARGRGHGEAILL